MLYHHPPFQNQSGNARRSGGLSGEVCLGKHPCLEVRLGEHSHLNQFRGFEGAIPRALRFQNWKLLNRKKELIQFPFQKRFLVHGERWTPHNQSLWCNLTPPKELWAVQNVQKSANYIPTISVAGRNQYQSLSIIMSWSKAVLKYISHMKSKYFLPFCYLAFLAASSLFGVSSSVKEEAGAVSQGKKEGLSRYTARQQQDFQFSLNVSFSFFPFNRCTAQHFHFHSATGKILLNLQGLNQTLTGLLLM